MIDAAQQAAAAGDYAASERLLRDAAATQEATLGSSHPDLAITLNNLAFVCEQTGLNLYARRAQVSKAFAGDFWIQVLDGRDDAFDPRGEQCVAARRGTSVMRVRFE